MRRAAVAILASAVLPHSVAVAQTFPVKPVRYVVPFGAGTSPDIVGRLIADKLSRIWGQQVIVDNRVGAAGTMGTNFVAKSPPDGHTLIQCNIASSAIAVSLFVKMPYDQLRDVAAVTRIGTTPNIVTTHPSTPFRSMKDLIAYAKRNPGKLSYTSGLVGTSPQLSFELVKLIAKIDIVNIPYKNGAQGITDTIGGQVPINISNFPQSVAPVQSGRLRPLAVTTAQRAATFPEVPTMQEAGLAGYEVSSWQGVCAPGGTPPAVLEKINADVNGVLRMTDVHARLEELMMGGPETTREQFDQFIRGEISRWARVIKEAGIPQQ
ncbi:MAG TPA: tripartite tricarboxylate transporter substrate binding protein [Burkholderiales bacterium]|nr:tripartite tricarboxylate transporter substrate binding protein [Burkholderiales bacterium]